MERNNRESGYHGRQYKSSKFVVYFLHCRHTDKSEIGH